MPISLRCPKCCKPCQFGEQMAGRRVRCECGITMTVPKPAVEAVEAAAEAASQQRAEEAETDRLRQQWIENRREARRMAARIGLIATVYGAVTAPAFLALELYGVSQTGLGILEIIFPWWLMRPFFAAGIAGGGVLMRKGDKRGLEFIGLCSGLLLLFPFWELFATGPQMARAHGLAYYLGQVLFSVVIYSVPAYAVYWCWKLKTKVESPEES